MWTEKLRGEQIKIALANGRDYKLIELSHDYYYLYIEKDDIYKEMYEESIEEKINEYRGIEKNNNK
jgi:uncharacterized protein (DUF427 family)